MKIVISGASRGIGRAIVMEFAKRGFDIGVCSRDKDKLEELRSEWKRISSSDTQLYTFSCDVSKKEEVEKFGQYVIENMGIPDVLVNNAGVFIPGQIHQEMDGTLEKQIETNLYSAYYLTRFLVPGMIQNQSGQIFNICSTASQMAYPNGGSYSISKFALLGFSKCLREELKPYNIKVCSILPGPTLTDSWAGVELPETRFMKPEDIAKSIYDIYCLSPQTVVEEIVLRPVPGDI